MTTVCRKNYIENISIYTKTRKVHTIYTILNDDSNMVIFNNLKIHNKEHQNVVKSLQMMYRTQTYNMYRLICNKFTYVPTAWVTSIIHS